MATNELAMTPFGAMMLVSTSAEDRVSCPSCVATIRLQDVEAEPGCLTVACPSCKEQSLLVRLVHVLHRAVRMPGALLARLGDRAESGEVPQAVRRTIQTPLEIFSLPVSKGAVVLLAMLWTQAERSGATTIESSVAKLSRQLLTGRAVVRRWLGELDAAGALREVPCEQSQRRRWELLPVPGGEVGDAGR